MIPTKEGPAVAVATELLHQPCPGPGHLLEEFMTTILIVVVLLIAPRGRGILRLSPPVVTIRRASQRHLLRHARTCGVVL